MVPSSHTTTKNRFLSTRLELRIGRRLGCMLGHRLHQAEPSPLHCLDGRLLLLLHFLVRSLEALHALLKSSLGLIHNGLLFLDELLEFLLGHLLELFDLRLLSIVAEVDVHGRAGRDQLLFDVLLEGLVVPPALIVLQVRRVAEFERRKPFDAVGVAQGLARRRAVHISHKFRRIAGKLVHEFVPIRCKLFAVPAPRRKELDKDRLASSLVVEVVRG
mmetsp:Transcript_12777/g.30071  ORF Transcript_12777/g.30071 Transcript_12777/m.30071 type:complete len:217 (-) Transcript_12777:142-792(-)